jgi:hypothetical protein
VNGLGHIEVYEGYYVKELIFPNFREEGKELNIDSYLREERVLREEKEVQRRMMEIRQGKI